MEHWNILYKRGEKPFKINDLALFQKLEQSRNNWNKVGLPRALSCLLTVGRGSDMLRAAYRLKTSETPLPLQLPLPLSLHAGTITKTLASC